MSRRDPATFGLLGDPSIAKTSDHESRLAIRERMGSGGGGGGSIVDATTSVKGKLKLAGMLAGTADVPIIATTATPQITRLGFGLAPVTASRAIEMRSTGGTSGTDALSNSTTYYWANYADATVVATPFTALRKNLGAPTATGGVSSSFRAYVTGHGAGLQGGGPGIYSGFLANVSDHANVNRGNITGISTGGVVTHDGTCQPVVGERVAIFATTRSQHNITWIVASVTDSTNFTLTSPDGFASTGGTVNNAPGWYAFGGTVSPRIDRNVEVVGTGPFNADDVGGFAMSNQGAGRATDGFYLGLGGGSGSQWWTAFACDADVEIGFNLGTINLGADNIGSPYGLVGAGLNMSKVTCVSGAVAINLRGGHGKIAFRPASDTGFSGTSFYRLIEPDANNNVLLGDSNVAGVVIPNNKGLYGVNAAASNIVQIARIDSGDNLQVGHFGTGTVYFTQNSAEVFQLDTGAQFKLATGKRIYGGDGIVLKTKAGAIVDGDYTTPTDGMLGVDETNNILYFRSNGAWASASGYTPPNPFTITGTTLSEIIADATSNSSDAYLRTKARTSGGTVVQGDFRAYSGGGVFLSATSNHYLGFFQAGSESFRVTTSQHVQVAAGNRIGIGVDPVSALHFVASTTATDGVQFGSDATPIQFYRAASGAVRLDTATGTDMGLGFNSSVGGSGFTGVGAFIEMGANGPTFFFCKTASTQNILAARVRTGGVTDANPRMALRLDGLRGGPGSTAADVAFSRVSANTWEITNASTGAGHLQFTNSGNIITDTTTGTKFGTATGQKFGWWNATPAVQPTAVADATGGALADAEARTALNALLARLRTIGLIAT